MTAENAQKRASLLPLLWAVLALFAVAIAYHAPNKLDHDVSYFLAVSHLVNQGDRLYVDLIDVNTPASVFVSQVSDWVASALHTPLDQTHKVTVMLIAAMCIGLCFRVLSPLLSRPGPARWCIAVGLAAVVLFGTPGIGGREHLAMTCLMPWVLSVAMGDRTKLGVPLGIAIGFLAGGAMLFKPYFALFGLTIGLVDLIRVKGNLRRLSLATWVAGVVSTCLYLGLFILVPTYLSEMIPFTVETFGRFGAGRLEAIMLLFGSGKLIATLVLVLVLMRPAKGERIFSLPVVVGLVFVTTAIAIYVAQGFAFEYQLLPAKIALAVCVVFLLANRLTGDAARFPSLPGPKTSGVVAVVTFAIVMSWPPDVITPYPQRQQMLEEPLLAALTPPNKGDPILVISTSVDPTSEFLTYLDVQWSGPILAYVPVPALIYQNGRSGLRNPPPPDVRDFWTAWFRGKAAKRFAERPPVRVAVEISKLPVFFQNPDFDILAWLREDAAFDAAWKKAGLQKTGSPIEWRDRVYQMYAPAP